MGFSVLTRESTWKSLFGRFADNRADLLCFTFFRKSIIPRKRTGRQIDLVFLRCYCYSKVSGFYQTKGEVKRWKRNVDAKKKTIRNPLWKRTTKRLIMRPRMMRRLDKNRMLALKYASTSHRKNKGIFLELSVLTHESERRTNNTGDLLSIGRISFVLSISQTDLEQFLIHPFLRG